MVYSDFLLYITMVAFHDIGGQKWTFSRVVQPANEFPPKGEVVNLEARAAVSLSHRRIVRQTCHPQERLCQEELLPRSSSREARIGVPTFFCSLFVSVVYFSRGNPPPKKGKRALLGDLDSYGHAHVDLIVINPSLFKTGGVPSRSDDSPLNPGTPSYWG